jgi:hypothetical protein
MRITPMSSATKSAPLVGNVPGPAGVTFLPTIAPAIPSAGTIIRKRPMSMSAPSARFQKRVLALSPPNAEPLLPAPLENAYSISESPCGPALAIDEMPQGTTAAQAVRPRIISGKTST